jgi:AcrR family transcriptional regulator
MSVHDGAPQTPASPTGLGLRSYHSPARQRQAEATRRAIVVAARTLFARLGYAGATLEAIAEEAGVSAKTVVAAFGSKRGILAEVVNPAALGGPTEEALTRLRAEPEPARRLALVAALTRQVYGLFGAEFELLRGAGVVAPELADIASVIERRRRSYQERLIAFLHERGALRTDLALDEAADELWALTSFDLYRMLVMAQEWRPERYELWLTDILTQRLLTV